MRRLSTLVCLLGGTLACGDSGTGEVGGDMNPPQESASDGTTDTLSANIDVSFQGGVGVFGLSAGEVADGWTLEYTRFLVTFGTITFTRADGSKVEQDELVVLDLLAAASPLSLASVKVPHGINAISFTVPNAQGGFVPHVSASSGDVDAMVKGGYSVLVEGRITKADGHTCVGDDPPLCTPAPEVTFSWGVAAGALLGDCPELDIDADEVLLLDVPGDRWLHTNFASAVAAPPVLRAQWIADADSDRDGEVTLDELAEIKARTMFTPAKGYDVRSGAPIAVETARDFVEAQARMIGADALGCGKTSPQ